MTSAYIRTVFLKKKKLAKMFPNKLSLLNHVGCVVTWVRGPNFYVGQHFTWVAWVKYIFACVFAWVQNFCVSQFLFTR